MTDIVDLNEQQQERDDAVERPERKCFRSSGALVDGGLVSYIANIVTGATTWGRSMGPVATDTANTDQRMLKRADITRDITKATTAQVAVKAYR